MEPQKRSCEWCGDDFFPRRTDARFCWPGSKCRTAAHRARKKAAAKAEAARITRLRAAISRVSQNQENRR